MAIPGLELNRMRSIPGLPLADPSLDSLGRLNGQCPGLLYVACAHYVGIVRVPAGNADKFRLTSPVRNIHHLALKAALRCVWGRDELEFTAAFGQLVPAHAGKHTPPLVEDGTVQAGLGPNVPARLLDRTFRAADMFFTCNFSILTIPWLWAISAETLCSQSLRALASRCRRRDIFPFNFA